MPYMILCDLDRVCRVWDLYTTALLRMLCVCVFFFWMRSVWYDSWRQGEDLDDLDALDDLNDLNDLDDLDDIDDTYDLTDIPGR